MLTKLAAVAFFTDDNLHSLVACRAVNLSLERGNCDASCVAYVQLGLIAGSRFGDYEAAYRFGRLGYDLVEQRGLKRFQARTYNNFGVHILPFATHFKAARDLLRRSFEAANRNGDLTFMAYSRANLNTNLLAAGDPLVEVQREAEHGLAFTQKMRFGLVADIIVAQLGLVRTLRGSDAEIRLVSTTSSSTSFNWSGVLAVTRICSSPSAGTGSASCRRAFTPATMRSAIAAASRAQKLLWTSLADCGSGGVSLLRRAVPGGVPRLRVARPAAAASGNSGGPPPATRESGREKCPENFENRAALVGAEIARIEGPCAGCRAPVRTGHPIRPRKRLYPE